MTSLGDEIIEWYDGPVVAVRGAELWALMAWDSALGRRAYWRIPIRTQDADAVAAMVGCQRLAERIHRLVRDRAMPAQQILAVGGRGGAEIVGERAVPTKSVRREVRRRARVERARFLTGRSTSYIELGMSADCVDRFLGS